MVCQTARLGQTEVSRLLYRLLSPEVLTDCELCPPESRRLAAYYGVLRRRYLCAVCVVTQTLARRLYACVEGAR